MSVRLNGSTSGYSEISAPAVAGDQTFTLPTTGGTVLTDASDLTTQVQAVDITAQVKTATNATGSAPIYSCRAWVNFSGSGTVSIRDSGNVSSITDAGTGNYNVNFTTAMNSTSFCGQATINTLNDRNVYLTTYNTTYVKVRVVNPSGVAVDSSIVNVATFE